jgi:hypothetical protein
VRSTRLSSLAAKGPMILAYFPRFCNGQEGSHKACLMEIIKTKAAALNDACERAERYGFLAVHRYNDLTPIAMRSFLVTALLADLLEPMMLQDAHHVLGVQ